MMLKIAAVLVFASLASAGLLPVQTSAPHVYHSVPVQPNTYVAHAPAPVTVYKTSAPVVDPHAPHVLAKQDEEYDPHPQYTFGYEVHDALSGDSKSQVEERDGDVVHGEYSLVDADGFKRTVQYSADSVNGFNAVVNRVPLEHTHTVKSSPVP